MKSLKDCPSFLEDLVILFGGEYAPLFKDIPKGYRDEFKGWVKEEFHQDWGDETLIGGKKVPEEISLENWNKGWQIYNREYMVHVIKDFLEDKS